MEGCPKALMINFDLKEAGSTENAFEKPLSNYIQEFYHENPQSYSHEVQQITQLRKSINSIPRDMQGCSTLRKYYAQLHYLQSRFPMGEGGAAAVPFAWYDVYSCDQVVYHDIRYEQACVLFNLGGLYSQLAANEDRLTDESMKTACTLFQNAAGAFQYLRENFSLNEISDMNDDILGLKSTIVLGQALECILEKSIRDDRNATLVARVAMQVRDYFRNGIEYLNKSGSSEMGSTLQKLWKKHLNIKILCYESIAYIYMSNDVDKNEKYGEKVTYLKAAFEKMTEASKLLKNQPDKVVDFVRFITDVVGNKYEGAVKDNEFVYHMSVPELSSLGDIKAVNFVKPLPFKPDEPSVSGPDIFQKLVPIKAHEASSLYSEKKDALVRKVAAEIEEKDVALSQNLSALKLEDLFDPKEDTLPDELLSKNIFLQDNPDLVPRVEKSAGELMDVTAVVEASLMEMKELLDTEKTIEQNISKEISGELQLLCSELEECNIAHTQASKTNAELVKHATESRGMIQLLGGDADDILQSLPSQNIVDAPEDEPVVQRIREILNKVEKMRSQRKELINKLRKQLHEDDITRKLVVREAGNNEAFFDEELEKHKETVGYIQQNLTAQENIIQALTEANAKYADTRQKAHSISEKFAAQVKAYIHVFSLYLEVKDRLSAGLEFYNSLNANVSALLEKVRIYSNTKRKTRPMPVTPARPSAKKPDIIRSNKPNFQSLKPQVPMANFDPTTVHHQPVPANITPIQEIGSIAPVVRPNIQGLVRPLQQNIPDIRPSFATSMNQLPRQTIMIRNQIPCSPTQQIQPPQLPTQMRLNRPDVLNHPEHMVPFQQRFSNPNSPNTRPPVNAIQMNPRPVDFINDSNLKQNMQLRMQQSQMSIVNPQSPQPRQMQHSRMPIVNPQSPQPQQIINTDLPFHQFPPQARAFRSAQPIQQVHNDLGQNQPRMRMPCPIRNTQPSQGQFGPQHTMQPNKPFQIQQPILRAIRPHSNVPPFYADPKRFPNQPGQKLPLQSRQMVPQTFTPNSATQENPIMYPPRPSDSQNSLITDSDMTSNKLPPPLLPQQSSSTLSSPVLPNTSYSFENEKTYEKTSSMNSNILQENHQLPNMFTQRPVLPASCSAVNVPRNIPNTSYTMQPRNDLIHPRFQQNPGTGSVSQHNMISSPQYQQNVSKPSLNHHQQQQQQQEQQQFLRQTIPEPYQQQTLPSAPVPTNNFQRNQTATITQKSTTPFVPYSGPSLPPGSVDVLFASKSTMSPSSDPIINNILGKTDNNTQQELAQLGFQQFQLQQVLLQQQQLITMMQSQQNLQKNEEDKIQTLQTQILAQQKTIEQMMATKGVDFNPREVNEPQNTTEIGQQKLIIDQQAIILNLLKQSEKQQEEKVIPNKVETSTHVVKSSVPLDYPSVISTPHISSATLTSIEHSSSHQSKYVKNTSVDSSQSINNQVKVQNKFDSKPDVQTPKAEIEFSNTSNSKQFYEPKLDEKSFDGLSLVLPRDMEDTLHDNMNKTSLTCDDIIEPRDNLVNHNTVDSTSLDTTPEITLKEQFETPCRMTSPDKSNSLLKDTSDTNTILIDDDRILPRQNTELQHTVVEATENLPKEVKKSVSKTPTVKNVSNTALNETEETIFKPIDSSLSNKLVKRAINQHSITSPDNSNRSSPNLSARSSPNLSARSSPTLNTNGQVVQLDDIDNRERSLSNLIDHKHLARQLGRMSFYVGEPDEVVWKSYIKELDLSAHKLQDECKALCKPENTPNVDGFGKIWNGLAQVEVMDVKNFTATHGEENTSKNRYRDILPWDHSRVKLKSLSNDYINASMIEDLTPLSPRYIATQGPIPQCFEDFWTMVWEQKSSIIVMLTNEVEGHKLKCHRYWGRDKDTPVEYGQMVVIWTEEIQVSAWKIRTFTLLNKKEDSTRRVKQLQFTSWPDYGTPDTPYELLSFMEEVFFLHQRNDPSYAYPLILHCSAGVGRTGSFCCIYSAIREIEGQHNLIEIPGVVRKLRQFRPHMVQRKEQMIFCYQAILAFAKQFITSDCECCHQWLSATKAAEIQQPFVFTLVIRSQRAKASLVCSLERIKLDDSRRMSLQSTTSSTGDDSLFHSATSQTLQQSLRFQQISKKTSNTSSPIKALSIDNESSFQVSNENMNEKTKDVIQQPTLKKTNLPDLTNYPSLGIVSSNKSTSEDMESTKMIEEINEDELNLNILNVQPKFKINSEIFQTVKSPTSEHTDQDESQEENDGCS